MILIVLLPAGSHGSEGRRDSLSIFARRAALIVWFLAPAIFAKLPPKKGGTLLKIGM